MMRSLYEVQLQVRALAISTDRSVPLAMVGIG